MGGGSTLVYGDETLPIEVCEWADITHDGKFDVGLGIGPNWMSVKKANDGLRISLEGMAALIECSELTGYTADVDQ